MCQPGRPAPQGESQIADSGSSAFAPFQSAKSRGSRLPRGSASAAASMSSTRWCVSSPYDGSGDVYFDTGSWSAYGELTRQARDNMEAAADADPRGKRDPRDFALWKSAKPGEPTWPTPWGPGRPGWHLECSAMAHKYLGAEFDIHGGGLDLRFPHHENELAQSTAAGDAFARYWMHNGLVTVNGQKMSKSLGNFLLAEDVLRERDPLVVRYALAAAHYRSSLDITPSTFDEAESALDRIRTFLERVARAGDFGWFSYGNDDFAAALDDDLGVPQALAVVHSRVREGNTALDAGDLESARTIAGEVFVMTNVLGINPLAAQWQAKSGSAEASALDDLVQTMITQRADARATKDWGTADRIRDAIAAAGIALEDTAEGTHWTLSGAPGTKEN